MLAHESRQHGCIFLLPSLLQNVSRVANCFVQRGNRFGLPYLGLGMGEWEQFAKFGQNWRFGAATPSIRDLPLRTACVSNASRKRQRRKLPCAGS